MTDHEARELLRLSHTERKLRGFLKAFSEEIESLACQLSHRAHDRIAADMRDLVSQGARRARLDGVRELVDRAAR